MGAKGEVRRWAVEAPSPRMAGVRERAYYILRTVMGLFTSKCLDKNLLNFEWD